MAKPVWDLVYEARKNGEKVTTLQGFVDVLKKAPKTFFDDAGVVLDKDEAKLLRAVRQKKLAAMEWLERFQLGKSYLMLELGSNWKVHYRPQGEKSIALLRIAQEVYNSDPLGWAHNLYESREHFWFSCEMASLMIELEKNGLLGGAFKRTGKVAQHNQLTENIRGWEDRMTTKAGPLVYYNELARKEGQLLDPERLLLSYATDIARDDTVVRAELFKQLATIKRWDRLMCRDPDMQEIGLDQNRQLDIGGKHKRGSGKKNERTAKSNGFTKIC
jgi:hypothetical protein